MREELKLTDRTCYNRRSHLLTFLKANGIEKLLQKKDKVRYVMSEPEVYDEDQLHEFFAACDDDERVFFEFLWMTGFRKKEASFRGMARRGPESWRGPRDGEEQVRLPTEDLRRTRSPDSGQADRYTEDLPPTDQNLCSPRATTRPVGIGRNCWIFVRRSRSARS